MRILRFAPFFFFLFPEPLTATGEGIAWQLGYVPFLSSYYFTQKILCHSRLTLHLDKAHAAIVIVTPLLHILLSAVYHWFPMLPIQSLLSLVHASCRQRYSPKRKVFILPCISLALHTFSCMIWTCDLAKSCTSHPPIPLRGGLILLHQHNLSNSGV